MWITLDEVYKAYLDCRANKRNSKSCSLFEENEAYNLYVLWEELNDYTYKIGASNAFCVTRPKIREVFAADFRDRIVHHILVNKIGTILDTNLIHNTFSCREGKGTLYGIRSLKRAMDYNPEMWNVKLDMRGFFYSINKNILWKKLKKILRTDYNCGDLKEVLWLSKMIVMHEPQNLCIKKGDLALWDSLPKDRSLFTCRKGFGLAIGNLTSQLFANFYLMDFDNFMFDKYGERYNRYVDDIVITGTHEEVLEAIGLARNFLKMDVMVELHPKKVFIQPCRHGITWIGYTVKQGRLYTGNRTIHNGFRLIDVYNKMATRQPDSILKWLERFQQRVNSYFGFMQHTDSYAIRYRMLEKIDDSIKQYIYPGVGKETLVNIACIKIKKKYRRNYLLRKRYKRYRAKYRHKTLYRKNKKSRTC